MTFDAPLERMDPAAQDGERGRPLFIVGPTGSGKSALAVALAEKLGGEIVNADAFQVYRGIEILTAAPGAEARRRVPHHLYGILDPAEEFSAARFANLARPVLAAIAARRKLGIVVGGSGLYVKALTHRLSDLPADQTLRSELRAQPLPEKVARLRALDPAGAATMNLSNPRYVERALEITLLTGQPASVLKTRWSSGDPPGARGIFLSWPRELLFARINRRVEEMFGRGGEATIPIDEARRIEAGAGFSATAAKALGVALIRRHLAGEIDRDQLISSLQQATRHYAKRQTTWFRRESWLKTICLDQTAAPESAVAQVLHLFGL